MPTMITPLVSEPIIILTLVGRVDIFDLRHSLVQLAHHLSHLQGTVYRINDVYDLRLSEKEWYWLAQAYRQSTADSYSQLINVWVSESPLILPADIPLDDRAPIFSDFNDALQYARAALYHRQSRRALWYSARPWLVAHVGDER